jgi:plasmid maintenance system antidote protein VapI
MRNVAATPPTAEDLRALLARARIKIYEVAPDVGCHPTTLGRMLNERAEMPADVAVRLQEVVERIVHERRNP